MLANLSILLSIDQWKFADVLANLSRLLSIDQWKFADVLANLSRLLSIDRVPVPKERQHPMIGGTLFESNKHGEWEAP